MTEKDHLNDSIKLPRAFIFRRLHSIVGGWLVIYLFYHLLVNSQAALFFKDEGHHFVSMVNSLENLPFLQAVELLFIGLPFFVHIVWGVIYLLQAKPNSLPSDGTKPSLYQYRKNRAYSWQRVTSWILIIAIIGHVVHMRFLRSPQEISEESYVTRVEKDPQLEHVAKKLKVQLQEGKEGEAIAYSETPGPGFFLMVRDSFKNPYMALLYSLFVIFSCYHAFNGLWTLLITWGITMTKRAQKNMQIATSILMAVTIFLGLLSIWGTYFTYVFSK